VTKFVSLCVIKHFCDGIKYEFKIILNQKHSPQATAFAIAGVFVNFCFVRKFVISSYCGRLVF